MTTDPSPIVVLIADDEPDARERVRRLVEREVPNAQFLLAQDGSEALTLAERAHWKVHLAILDQYMPDYSGVQIARILGAHDVPYKIVSSCPPLAVAWKGLIVDKDCLGKQIPAWVHAIPSSSSSTSNEFAAVEDHELAVAAC